MNLQQTIRFCFRGKKREKSNLQIYKQTSTKLFKSCVKIPLCFGHHFHLNLRRKWYFMPVSTHIPNNNSPPPPPPPPSPSPLLFSTKTLRTIFFQWANPQKHSHTRQQKDMTLTHRAGDDTATRNNVLYLTLLHLFPLKYSQQLLGSTDCQTGLSTSIKKQRDRVGGGREGGGGGRETDRQRQTNIQREGGGGGRETERDRDRLRHRQTETDRETDKQTDRCQTDRGRDRDRQTQRERGGERERERERERNVGQI